MHLSSDLIKDTLLLIEEEEKKALAPGGFKLGTSREWDRCPNHFATTTAVFELNLKRTHGFLSRGYAFF